MRLHGWCERCHRVRLVTVRPAMLARRGVAVGVCAQCEENERERRSRR